MATYQVTLRTPSAIAIRVFLIVVTFVAYARSLGNGLVFDDNQYIVNNPHVRGGLSADNFAWAWTTGHASNWHPLTWLSLQVDAQFFGLERPWGYHAVNLFLHCANTILLFEIFLQATGALWRAAAVAAFFTLHPLHVESVAWVTERKDLLSTLFGFLALLFYIRFVRKPGRSLYLAVIIAFACSLLAKPMLVTLPFLLLLLDYWPLGRWKGAWDSIRTARGKTRSRPAPPVGTASPGQLIIEKLPLLTLCVASSMLTLLAQSAGGAVRSLEQLPFPYRLSNALVSYVVYLAQVFWPIHLSVFYPLTWSSDSIRQTIAASLLAITVAVVLRRRRAPYLFTGWFWYLGTLVPVIGLVQVGIQAHADRYTYVPLVGILVIIAWGLPNVTQRLGYGARVLGPLTGLAVAACLFFTWRQVGYWHDELTLWSHAAEVTPGSAIAHNNAGKPRLDRVVVEGERLPISERHRLLAEAERHFATAVAIDPDYAEARYNLGVVLEMEQKRDEAARTFAQFLERKPGDADARFHLGVIKKEQGQWNEAVAILQDLLKDQPDDREMRLELVQCLSGLAAAYAQSGNFDQAVARAEQALSEAVGHLSPAVVQHLEEQIRLYKKRSS